MVLVISTCKFDAQNIPDAFKHVPDLMLGMTPYRPIPHKIVF